MILFGHLLKSRRLTNNDGLSRSRAAFIMLVAGLGAMLAQIILLRELLVILHGQDLVLGLVFAAWLALVSAGAAAARFLLLRNHSTYNRRGAVSVLLLIMAFAPLVQGVLIRTMPVWLGLPPGRIVSAGLTLLGAFVSLAPLCICSGLLFPLIISLCGSTDKARKAGMSAAWIYSWEAVGAIAAGFMMTFLLVELLPPAGLLFLSGFCFLPALAVLRLPRPVKFLQVLVLILSAGLYAAILLDGAFERLRWRCLGVLSSADDPVGVELIAGRDTRFKNLTLTKSAGQFTLYSQGRAAAVFPDPFVAEERVCVAMAQKPAATRILAVGIDLVSELEALAKMPAKQIVVLEPDRGVREMLEKHVHGVRRMLEQDSRIKIVHADAATYLRRGADDFDTVLLLPGAPDSLMDNRFYTVEFFELIRRRLVPDGVLYFEVESSERMLSQGVTAAAAVIRAAATVFDEIRLTAGPVHRVYAGSKTAEISLSRETLYQRALKAGYSTGRFQPAFFLGTDDLSPEKIEYALARLESAETEPNRVHRPIAAFHNLQQWRNFTFSRWDALGWGALLAALAAPLPALWLLYRGRQKAVHGSAKTFFIWCSVLWVITTSGIAGMGAELVILFKFQAAYGYLYTHVGLLVAVFMGGLVAGALGYMLLVENLRMQRQVLLTAVLEAGFAALIGLALLSPWSDAGILPGEIAAVCLLLGIGFVVGCQFPLACNLLSRQGADEAFAAALTDGADHAGAAAGAAVIGSIVVPLLGLLWCAVILAGLKLGGALLMFAVLFMTRHRE